MLSTLRHCMPTREAERFPRTTGRILRVQRWRRDPEDPASLRSITAKEEELASAEHKQRLTGRFWGVSREQVEFFTKFVGQCLDEGFLVGDTDESNPNFYPESKFRSNAVGPTMYQVNDQIIKKVTAGWLTHEGLPELELPGVSWSLMLNKDGLQCAVFVSHAWGEGVFEFTRHVLVKWPEDAGPAYICFLANPQNLNIDDLLKGPAIDSPFGDALAGDNMRSVIMVGNSNVAIHSRLWCVYEAFLAKEKGHPVRLAGESRNFATSMRAYKCTQTINIVLVFYFVLILGYTFSQNNHYNPVKGFFVHLAVACLYIQFMLVIYFFIHLFCIRPAEYNLINPSAAQCSSDRDRKNITQAIEAELFGWIRIRIFMDELLNYHTDATNPWSVFWFRLFHDQRIKWQIGRFWTLICTLMVTVAICEWLEPDFLNNLPSMDTSTTTTTTMALQALTDFYV